MISFVQMPSVPYDKMFQRPQQIMTELSFKGHRIYYIESKPGNYVSKRTNNLSVLGADFDLKKYNLKGPIVLWCSCPEQVLNIDKIPHDYVVYDVVDDASHEFSCWSGNIENMLKRADLVFTSAESLYDKFKNKHEKVFLINNGVSNKWINMKRSRINKYKISKNRKTIGYVGAVASWIDWELVNHIVKDSEYNFAFIGPLYNIRRPPVIRSNVYFLGEKKYCDIPYYIQNFDCCIIPFKVNSMTNACNPIKLYEYMSLGKPIVTTNMKEIKKYNKLCYISKSEKEFKDNIDLAINEKDTNLQYDRMKVAMENSWEGRVEQILSIINRELNIK